MLTDAEWSNGLTEFSTTKCYAWLRGEGQTLAWTKAIWNYWCPPKHQFTGWLVAHQALKTADVLIRHGMAVDSTCPLCEMEEENAQHLFFTCPYSSQVCNEVHQLTGLQFPGNQCLQWCLGSRGNRLQCRIYNALVMGMVYYIWTQRNRCRIDKQLGRPKVIATSILRDIHCRIRENDRNRFSQSELQWLSDKNLM
ncbi:hypothetical protein vseg_015327 [Gypsophila vaccaria]